MKTITITLYRFAELSEEAKKAALNAHRNDFEDDWSREIDDSISEIADACDMRLIGRCALYPVFTSNNDIDFKSNARLMAYIWNNYIEPSLRGKYYSKGKTHRHSKVTKDFDCPFTGYCADYILWETWREFVEVIRRAKKTLSLDDFADLLSAHARREIDDNTDHVTSDEYVAEMLEVNNYEFLEDGTDY